MRSGVERLSIAVRVGFSEWLEIGFAVRTVALDRSLVFSVRLVSARACPAGSSSIVYRP